MKRFLCRTIQKEKSAEADVCVVVRAEAVIEQVEGESNENERRSNTIRIVLSG